ncbi:facilitated trehalose transporter Tret1-like [Anopheles ziemanni]|uniref:facilitated trehalose transporter Tret1-like n=1 Tax=Anopheles coustani TaxID=139045 RepID=UPI00265A73F4|nr:facilitated trehalose transporter Tret1-like [Anopheles coustani]XP_058166423.1 facilitated trehalose transporter Tret1-like [Anopheles ziemanni]
MSCVGVLRQYMATVLVNLLGVSYGTISGWSSSALPALQSTLDSPLQQHGAITPEEASWIAGTLCLGGVLGTLVGGLLVERLGRKWTAWTAGLPLVACWTLIIVADHPGYLMGARFVGGLGGGIVYVANPLYVSEIAAPKHRGALSSMLVLSCCVGMEVAYITAAFLSYHTIPWVCIVVPLIFLIGFVFVPESPLHLASIQNHQEAERSLRYFRGVPAVKGAAIPEEFERELHQLERMRTESQSTKQSLDRQLTWSDFNSRHAKRAFLISLTLMALNQFCGCFYMMNYAESVFAESSSSSLSLSANRSVIVVGLIQLCGCYSCTLLVDRMGRKILLVISALGTALGHSVFAAYCFGQYAGYDLTMLSWLPLVCFSVVIFIGSLGLGTLPFVVLAEIMPLKIKGFATTFCMVINWAVAFVALKYFSLVAIVIGMYGLLLFFAFCSTAGAIFVMFVMPETKGKDFQEIQKLMDR